MTALVLALVALGVAPLLDRALQGRPLAEGFADGFSQVAVAGLLLAHVVPAGCAAAGWPALGALVAGVVLGVVAHRLPRGEDTAEVVAALALLLHAGLDGAGLRAGGVLGWTVVLHTLPVGLATWRITRERRGQRAAAVLLALCGAVTVVGFLATGLVVTGASPAVLGVVQCLAAGALLHVLTHLGEHAPRGATAWGALAGVALVVMLSSLGG